MLSSFSYFYWLLDILKSVMNHEISPFVLYYKTLGVRKVTLYDLSKEQCKIKSNRSLYIFIQSIFYNRRLKVYKSPTFSTVLSIFPFLEGKRKSVRTMTLSHKRWQIEIYQTKYYFKSILILN